MKWPRNDVIMTKLAYFDVISLVVTCGHSLSFVVTRGHSEIF